MWPIYEKLIAFSSQHVILMHSAHFAAGFGIAILLQHYLKGHEFISPIVGWLLLGFGVVAHLMAFFTNIS